MNRYNDIVRMWRSWRVTSAWEIDARLKSFKILFAYNSCKIKNNKITYQDTQEIFENGRVVNFTGEPRVLFEIGNQMLCFEFLKHKIAARVPLTARLVLETHAALTGGTYDERQFAGRGERPGEFKKNDYLSGRWEIGSLHEDVPADMDALLSEIMAEFTDSNILKAAAYFYLRFEYIYPFAEGNGRVGRTLLNYFLMINNHPPIVIFEDDKAAYYTALEAYIKTEDIEPMHSFLRAQLERTWENALNCEVESKGE